MGYILKLVDSLNKCLLSLVLNTTQEKNSIYIIQNRLLIKIPHSFPKFLKRDYLLSLVIELKRNYLAYLNSQQTKNKILIMQNNISLFKIF